MVTFGWVVRTLNPTSFTMSSVWAEVTGTEKITVGGQEYDAYVITIPYSTGKPATVWANGNGDILRQQIFGFTFEREQPSGRLQDAE